ncbi:two component transcriptional regulator, LuxR family [Prosthecobacter debontii]|uniref:Two component transcriptional regulator, LuxR family n=1 Tax=Prosthecobacter debontii TaxID=48467 RepID=A0A1T4XLL9_9BACT|nr:response regulator transcription factor [Prosthecobacter debontii]SKA90396.1 two component transcriptional regulator, LuxR family [Prosthecobacter debontii]
MKKANPLESQHVPGRRHNGQIRTILIEDSTAMRVMLAAAVQESPALDLLDQFGSAEDALANVARLMPDVAVVDILLPGMDGISCISALKKEVPGCQILMLTAFEDSEKVFSALKAGASGYLIKSSNPNDLVQSIQDVWAGGAPMSASVARRVVESFHESAQSPRLYPLTAREEEILGFLAQGYLTKEIAGRVGVSYATVRFHLRNIYTKLHVNSRTQAVLKYMS